MQRRAGGEEAMVIVDEIDEAVVDPLVVGDVREGRMDAHAFADDLVERPAGAQKIVIDFARALLVARQNAIFELLIEGFGLVVAGGCGTSFDRHSWTPSSGDET